MLIERTRPYETLVRHKENGEVTAHQVSITEIVKDGLIISASLSDPAPVVGDIEEILEAIRAFNSGA